MLDEEARAAITAVGRIRAVPTMLRVITEVTGLRIALVARVTDARSTCCAVNDELGLGLAVGGELDAALGAEVRDARTPIAISRASRGADAAATRDAFESFAAAPIVLPDGQRFGAVCALDPRPVELSAPRTLALLELFAELVGMQLAAEATQAATSQALLDAREAAELREQFIAVLGHDLRSPLQAITVGAHVLESGDLPERATAVARRIGRSAARIGRLIDDVVDFARGRLGGGIPLAPSHIEDVTAVLRPVVEEQRAVHPDRNVELRLDGAGAMRGDPVRLAQLLQNLLANALAHSPPGTPVEVSIRMTRTSLILSVVNDGPAIPEPLRARMFEPYRRGTDSSPGGLGLGLYIASQIATSHGGAIEVTSVDGATTMTCMIPRSLG